MTVGLIFILATLALNVWIFSSVYRILANNELSPEWRKRAIVFLILGLGLAIYFAFIYKHDSAKQLRLTGFPVPQTITRLEGDEWKDLSPPRVIQILARIVDFISGFAVGLFPIKVAAFFKQAKASLPERRH